MFPVFLCCDFTFGVTKEQRNLFVIADIDENNKVFSCFYCYMPSKEARAFNWSLHSATIQVLANNALLSNQCDACDQDLSMYQPLRSLMANGTSSLKNSRNWLDKYHFLIKD